MAGEKKMSYADMANKGKEVKDPSKDVGNKAGDKAENAAGDASDVVASFGKGVSDNVKTTADKNMKMGGEAADEVEEKSGETKEKAAETKDAAKEKVGEIQDTAKESADDVKNAGSAKEKAVEKTGRAQDKASEMRDAGKKRADETKKSVGAKGLDSLESDITKKIDIDVLRTDEFPSTDVEEVKSSSHKYERSKFDVSSKHGSSKADYHKFDTSKHVYPRHSSKDVESTETSESDISKEIDTDVLKTDDFPALGGYAPSSTGKYKVKTADEEVDEVLSAVRGTAGDVSHKADDAIDNAAVKVKVISDAVGKKENETADAASDKTKAAAQNLGDAKESVKDSLVDAKDTVKDGARDINSEADKAASAHQPKVDEAKDEVGQKWDNTKEKASEFAGAVQDSAGAASNVVKEKTEQIMDTIGIIVGATKDKANEASEHIEEKIEDARKATSARADAAAARGEYTSDSEWWAKANHTKETLQSRADQSKETVGKATNTDVYPEAEEAKDESKGLLGFANILGEASKVIQNTVNASGERVSDH